MALCYSEGLLLTMPDPSDDLQAQVVNAAHGKMSAKGGHLLLNLSPVATVLFHHGVGGHPNTLSQALLAGKEINYVAGFTSEYIPDFVLSSCECAFEGFSFL